MRALHVNKLYHPWIGGVERVVQDLAEGLRSYQGVESAVLCCSPRGPGRREYVNGVPVIRCASLGMAMGMPVSPTFPAAFFRLGRRYPLVHLHMPFPLGAAAAVAASPALRHTGIIVHYHSDIVRQRRIQWAYLPLLRSIIARADRVIVTSPPYLQSTRLRHVLDKCVVIPPPIDLTRHRRGDPEASRQLRMKLGIPADGKVVLFVGRFTYYKGLEYLVDAMREIRATLVLVGDGPMEPAIRRRVAAGGSDLVRRVRLVGVVPDSDLGAYYDIADVFALPSVERTEAFGVVQLEAMARGVPVVNTELGTGVGWASPHGLTGLTVPPRRSDALAGAIRMILEDEQLRTTFSRNALDRVRAFDIRVVAETVARLYSTVLAERSPGSSAPSTGRGIPGRGRCILL